MADHKKHLTHNMKGEFIGLPESRSKSKPRVIEKSDYLLDYLLARDRVLWKEGKSRDEIKIKYNL